jgi:hypothetical protein
MSLNPTTKRKGCTGRIRTFSHRQKLTLLGTKVCKGKRERTVWSRT